MDGFMRVLNHNSLDGGYQVETLTDEGTFTSEFSHALDHTKPCFFRFWLCRFA